MVLQFIRAHKGKSLLVAGIILIWILMGTLFINYGYQETWELWGVPVEKSAFLDFQLIPGSAESFRNGFEPSIENPKDPGGRIFNYPAFWRLFFYTNISLDDTIWIVVLMLLLYFLSVMVFPQDLSIIGAWLMLLVIFSPASMLLYERGNADLIVFFLCVLTVLTADYSAALAAVIIVFGAVVKMFPLLGISVLVKEGRQRFWRLAIACIGFMIVYGLLTFRSLDAAWNTTMRGDGLSYGTFVLITRLSDYLQTFLGLTFTQLQILSEGLGVILILLGAHSALRRKSFLKASNEQNLSAFRMGTSIYIGTFLLGNNWDYRLAFLVLVIPQLVEWFRSNDGKTRTWTYFVSGLILLSCWHLKLSIDLPFIPLKDPANRIVVVDEVFNWLLVPGFTYLLVSSLPDWFRSDLQKLLGFLGHLYFGKRPINNE